MTSAAAIAQAPAPQTDTMKDLVALCKRRGFVFPASDIYGGINGFWDYGPLGVLLKNNMQQAWWKAMVLTPPIGPDGQPVEIVGLDSAIIQNPKCWEASGHVAGFSDPMVDCRETKLRYRADKLTVMVPKDGQGPWLANHEDAEADVIAKRVKKLGGAHAVTDYSTALLSDVAVAEYPKIIGPDTTKAGTLTEPKAFNLLFETRVGAVATGDNTAYLRGETCAGIFLNFKNVVDSSRVRVPFGIAQVGKAFRNEVNPRNFIFRSREFEQMELEWFCHPDDHALWFDFWVAQRKQWWLDIGLDLDKLKFRQQDAKELAHYSTRTIDIEYKFPFTDPGFGEIEGIAHRGNFDLTQHQSFSGTKLEYLDQVNNERFLPHVIEPSSGLTRGLLALLCEAYTVDPNRPSGVYMNFHPSIAPKKAAILPLTTKDGHPELATKLYMDLREEFSVDLDIKQNIGKRYARQDEIGTPFCITIDDTSLSEHTVTVRERNTMAQERIKIDDVATYLRARTKPGTRA